MNSNPKSKRINVETFDKIDGSKVHRASYTDEDLYISTMAVTKKEARMKLERQIAALGKGKQQRGMFRWIVTIDVAEVWVADGFDLDDDRLESIMMTELGYARGDEATGTVLFTPDQNQIAKIQGYKDADDKRKREALNA